MTARQAPANWREPITHVRTAASLGREPDVVAAESQRRLSFTGDPRCCESGIDSHCQRITKPQALMKSTRGEATGKPETSHLQVSTPRTRGETVVNSRMSERSDRARPTPVPIGNQHLDLAANQLLAAVAEELLRLGIRKLDLALVVHDHHRIGSGLEHRPGVRLRSLQLRAHPDLIREVDRHQQEPNRLAVAVAPRSQDHSSDEVAGVLASTLDPPLPLPLLPRLIHHSLWQAAQHILLGVQ